MKKSTVLVGAAVTAAALYAMSQNNDDSDIAGALGGMWGGGSATTTTTTTETPSDAGTPLPSIVLPSIAPVTIPAPDDIFSDPIVTNTSNAPTTKKSVSTGVSTGVTSGIPLTTTGGNTGYGGGGVGGRSGNAQSGGFSINPLSAALGFIGGGLPGLFGSVIGDTAISSVFGGVTPANTTKPTTVHTLPGTITVSIPADGPSAVTKKSATIGGETYTDSAGNFSGARTYPDYSKAAIGNDGALYAPYTVTEHTGHVLHQVERTSAVSGKKHVMSTKSAAILSGNSAAAKAWRAKYGDSGHSSSSSKKSSYTPH